MQYLEEQGEKIPALAETFAKFGELYTARLWHQLSVELRAFVSAAPADYDLASFYAKFIKSSEDKLTPLLLAHTVTAIAGRNEGTWEGGESARAPLPHCHPPTARLLYAYRARHTRAATHSPSSPSAPRTHQTSKARWTSSKM